MPLSVSCACGKQFRVRDDLAGSRVKCQVCGADCQVPVSEAFDTPIAPYSPPTAVQKNLDTKPCPACAEEIPESARICPLCKEVLSDKPVTLDASEREVLIERIKAELPRDSMIEQVPFLSRKSKVVCAVMAFSILSILSGLILNAEGLWVLGIVVGIFFFIPIIVCLVHDNSASHIQDAPSAEVALKNYMAAIKTGRVDKAFAALAPTARNVTDALTIRYKNPKIVNNPTTLPFNDPESFKKYWKYNFTAPSMTSRNVTIGKAKSIRKTPDGIEIIELTTSSTSHSSLLFLLIFVNLIFAAVIIFAVQQKEDVVVRKALLKHNGRWYILDGSIEGELDRML